MSYAAVRNVPTADGFTEAATLYCPGASAIVLTVRNAAVLVELGEGTGPNHTSWTTEPFFEAPRDRTLVRTSGRPLDAIRIKSAVAGVPAQVSMDAS